LGDIAKSQLLPGDHLDAFCESKGNPQWYVVEHESGKDPLDAVRRSYEALKKMGKV
jgi:hypothetical protein